MAFSVTFSGETLDQVCIQIHAFLADLSDRGDPVDALMALDGPLPPAVKAPPGDKHGRPSVGQIKAYRDACAPPAPTTAEDVKASLKAYLDRFGEETAGRHAPKLMGARKVSDLKDDHSRYLAKSALDAALAEATLLD